MADEKAEGKSPDLSDDFIDLMALSEPNPQIRIAYLRESYARHFSETMKNKIRLKDMEFKLEELIETLKKVKKATSHPEKEESAQIITTQLVRAGKLWKQIMDEIKSWNN